MVAQLATSRALPLLLEPDPRPQGARGTWHGWRYGGQRCHEDDAWGAVVQDIVVRYASGEAGRAALAREYDISERQIQAYVSGKAWKPYAHPVLRALTRLGIGVLRHGRGRRRHEIVQGMARLAGDLSALLAHDTRALAQRARGDLAVIERLGVLSPTPAPPLAAVEASDDR